MRLPTLLLIVAAMVIAAFFLARRRAIDVAGGYRKIRVLHSLPQHYGYYAALCAALPAVAVLLLWALFSDSLITCPKKRKATSWCPGQNTDFK